MYPRAGVGILVAALLAPPLCLDVVLLILCCGAAVQLFLRFFPEEVDPDVAVYSLCLREVLTSGSACAAVLKSSPVTIFHFFHSSRLVGVQESYYFEACTHYPKVVSNESDRLDASMMKLNKG